MVPAYGTTISDSVDKKFAFVLGSTLRFPLLGLVMARVGQSSLGSDTGTTAFN
jgi:hypothetical protein